MRPKDQTVDQPFVGNLLLNLTHIRTLLPRPFVNHAHIRTLVNPTYVRALSNRTHVRTLANVTLKRTLSNRTPGQLWSFAKLRPYERDETEHYHKEAEQYE